MFYTHVLLIRSAILEPELPQMSTKQLIDTYHSKLTADTCPAMIDMIGSTRPKIFSMLKIIERYGERYEMAKEHYKILLNNLPVEDHVSFINLTTAEGKTDKLVTLLSASKKS